MHRTNYLQSSGGQIIIIVRKRVGESRYKIIHMCRGSRYKMIHMCGGSRYKMIHSVGEVDIR